MPLFSFINALFTSIFSAASNPSPANVPPVPFEPVENSASLTWDQKLKIWFISNPIKVYTSLTLLIVFILYLIFKKK